jgi:glutamate racemase
LLSRGVKMVVVACNTVSAVALDVVQKRARLPVVGVIGPGAGAAVRATRRSRVGIIGTSATVASNAYTHALRSLAPEIMVFARACPLFVPLAEEGWVDHPVTLMVAKEYLFPLQLEKIDTLVLGCTHYPVLRPAIEAVLPGDITLIDSGEAVAEEVERVLDSHALRNPSTQRPNLQFFVSDIPARFAEVGERFLGHSMGRVQRVTGF